MERKRDWRLEIREANGEFAIQGNKKDGDCGDGKLEMGAYR